MSLPSVACFRQMDIIDQLTALYEAILQISGGSFSPDQILGLQGWYKDSGIQNTESTVFGWNDESGNDNHLTSGEFQPSFVVAGLNGLNTVLFQTGDGITGTPLSKGSALMAGTSATMFIVAKKDSAWPDSGWYTINSTAQENRHPASDGDISDAFFCNSQKACGAQIVAINDNWRILSLRSQNAQYHMELDGGDQFSTATNTFSLGSDFILGQGGSTDSAFQGEIAEVIVYNAFLSDAQRDAVITYLRNRFNL